MDYHIIFLHGLACLGDGEKWLPQFFDDRFHFYSLDLSGHGIYGNKTVVDLDEAAGLVREKVLELKLSEYYLLGFSYGGVVGERYAQLYSEDKTLQGIIDWTVPIGSFFRALTFFARCGIWFIQKSPKFLYQFFRTNRFFRQIYQSFGFHFEHIEHTVLLSLFTVLQKEPLVYRTGVNRLVLLSSIDHILRLKYCLRFYQRLTGTHVVVLNKTWHSHVSSEGIVEIKKFVESHN